MGCDQLVTAHCKSEIPARQMNTLVAATCRRDLCLTPAPVGAVLFSAAAYWDDKERRIGIAQITRLARLPEVNFYAEPALTPQSGNSERRPRRGTGRLDPDPG
jgi:hypothetical protein